jgi:hypothetical protein
MPATMKRKVQYLRYNSQKVSQIRSHIQQRDEYKADSWRTETEAAFHFGDGLARRQFGSLVIRWFGGSASQNT